MYIGTDIKDENEVDQLRSILAQKEFTYEICRLDREESLPFRTHLYVPENIPLPGLLPEQRCLLPYHEREDEPHMLKVSSLWVLSHVFIYLYIANSKLHKTWGPQGSTLGTL